MEHLEATPGPRGSGRSFSSGSGSGHWHRQIAMSVSPVVPNLRITVDPEGDHGITGLRPFGRFTAEPEVGGRPCRIHRCITGG